MSRRIEMADSFAKMFKQIRPQIKAILRLVAKQWRLPLVNFMKFVAGLWPASNGA